MELLQVSDTADEQKPKMARLPSSANCVSCLGIFSDKKLYVKNQLQYSGGRSDEYIAWVS